MRVSGTKPWVSYHLRYIHAGPDYPGYYSDTELFSANAAFSLKNNLRLSGSFRYEEENLDQDPALFSAPLERYLQLGLDYDFLQGTKIFLDYRGRDRGDLLPIPSFDFCEDTVRLGATQAFQNLSLYASAELGRMRDRIEEATSHVQRYHTLVYFNPNSNQSFSGYFHYDTHSDFSGEKKRRITVGINANAHIARRTYLDLYTRTSTYLESGCEEEHNIQVKLSHLLRSEKKLFDNHTISLNARHTAYTNSDRDDETAFMIEYKIPFNLPVSRKKSVGTVRGKVYDAQTDKPVADVILRLNGATAVTNEWGEFIFPAVAPGTYYLNMNRARTEEDRVPVQKMPMEVRVVGGKDLYFDLAMTRGATVTGYVMLYEFENDHDSRNESQDSGSQGHYVLGGHPGRNGSIQNGDLRLVKARGLANILVELTNGSIRRRLTNRSGRFSFEDLTPGIYTLKVSSDNLPEYHHLEKGTFKFEVRPGERKEVEIRILPKRRKIHIIDEGDTLVEEEK